MSSSCSGLFSELAFDPEPEPQLELEPDPDFKCKYEYEFEYDSYKTLVDEEPIDTYSIYKPQQHKHILEHQPDNQKRSQSQCSSFDLFSIDISDYEDTSFLNIVEFSSLLCYSGSDNGSNNGGSSSTDCYSANNYNSLGSDFLYDPSSSRSSSVDIALSFSDVSASYNDIDSWYTQTNAKPETVNHGLHQPFLSFGVNIKNNSTSSMKPNKIARQTGLGGSGISQLTVLKHEETFKSDQEFGHHSNHDFGNHQSAEHISDAILYIARQILEGKIQPWNLTKIIKNRITIESIEHTFSDELQNDQLVKPRKRAGKFPQVLRNTKKGLQYLTVLGTIFGLLRSGKMLRRRDVYYKHLHCFASQRQVDSTCFELEHYFGVGSSHELHLVASPNGFVAGPIIVTLRTGQQIDYMLDTTQGMLIPDHNGVVMVEPGPKLKYVLIVEKEAVFFSLLQDRVIERQEILLVTGKGYPSHNTRGFLCLLHAFSLAHQHQNHRQCGIKWLVLTDNDPHGAHIFEVYYKSSPYATTKALYISTPAPSCVSTPFDYYLPVQWFGLHSEDRSRYRHFLFDDNRMPALTNQARIKCHQLAIAWSSYNQPYPGSSSNVGRRFKKWRMQVAKLVHSGKKAELEILSHTKAAVTSTTTKSVMLQFIAEKLKNPHHWL